jgi:hypothetical protein
MQAALWGGLFYMISLLKPGRFFRNAELSKQNLRAAVIIRRKT